ncbi:hypothetical protein [Mucilaginibacter polytrichastri]|uniref:Phosphatidate cytidylyltransferase n=1 Tax=Mucilaginibacter polytrichastri TaxID=1302689 RepID=A0A1Q6A0G4_9SPHI|nr:hypothetical protein [Mucilaginibacter polytrichastri]OKS87496.1 hypothetical protein RG47T_2957 [Mucilaginibacter polytrichastri]SFS91373.1 hypothetical protein SAMN04487890_10691 [Mucilaginibacter polytrichastri]
MKKNYIPLLLILLSLSSCTVIGDIFKAGAITAIIGIVIVVALVIWIISLFRGKNS